MTHGDLRERLLELESGFWSADGNYYREHMAAEGLCVVPVGVMDRNETVAAMDHSEPWAEFKLHDVTILDLGDDEAALCYRVEAFREDESPGHFAFISSVYVRVRGEWKLALHQQTPVETL
ncbi:MAG TPA: nuclear transport factor 2 family protein [Acidimicrobiia bacterium]|nr:nuclear transport factor 2 family protein [Acidimicrobiia bacterium]